MQSKAKPIVTITWLPGRSNIPYYHTAISAYRGCIALNNVREERCKGFIFLQMDLENTPLPRMSSVTPPVYS